MYLIVKVVKNPLKTRV